MSRAKIRNIDRDYQEILKYYTHACLHAIVPKTMQYNKAQGIKRCKVSLFAENCESLPAGCLEKIPSFSPSVILYEVDAQVDAPLGEAGVMVS